MGTNYYLRRDFCPCCGAPRQELHIGKCSYGWRFMAHVYKDGMTFDEYKNFLNTGTLYNEYGDQVAYNDLMDIILSTSHKQLNSGRDAKSWDECDYTKDDFR